MDEDDLVIGKRELEADCGTLNRPFKIEPNQVLTFDAFMHHDYMPPRVRMGLERAADGADIYSRLIEWPE